MKANLGALRAGDRVSRKPFRLRAGPLAETGGHSAIACFGQSGEHVDPRRIDDRGPGADDGVPSDHLLFPRRNLLAALRQG